MEQNISQNDDRQPYFCKMIGNTTYVVRVHFSETAKETLEDKLKRLLLDDTMNHNVIISRSTITAQKIQFDRFV